MKIIINQPRASYFVGGAEMISFDHAINFYELGNEVYFFTIDPKSVNLEHSLQFKKFKKNYSKKIKIIEIKQEKNIKNIYNIQPGEDRCRWNIESIYYNQKLYEYLNKNQERYDIIFSYYNLDAVFVPKNKIKTNVLYLCGIPKEQNDFQGSFLSVYDKVLAISNEVKDSWNKYSRNEIVVISTGVDCNRFIPQKKETTEITLLFVGRLISRKNIDKIIKAYEKLKNKYKLKLIITGDGPDRKRLERISSDCEFTGIITDTEKIYQKADIFISPSKYGEGLQGTILEAMSCGLTVVATNTKINEELLKDGRGFTINVEEKDIINGIVKAIETNRTEIRKKCRKYILKNYDWENKCKKILEAIK